MSITSNALAQRQFLTKAFRALTRSPAKAATLQPEERPAFLLRTPDGQLEPAYAFAPDMARIETVISANVRALYFHGTGQKLVTKLSIAAPAASFRNEMMDKNVATAVSLAKQLLISKPRQGANPEVFYYQLGGANDVGVMLLCFYAHTEFIAIWRR